MQQIHLKFKNFCIHRKNKNHELKKQESEIRVRQELQPSFHPITNKISSIKGRLDSSSSGLRTDQLYKQAQ
jgi:hypothetical protein